MKKKLRLLVTEICPRNCEGCCNKEWDLKKLPVCTDFSGYDEILITGGEPLSLPYEELTRILYEIKLQNKEAKIYLYTAATTKHTTIWYLLLDFLDGVCITAHENMDIYYLMDFFTWIEKNYEVLGHKPSLRLNVFKEVDVKFGEGLLTHWKVKDNIEWIPNCPLPDGEVFMRYYSTSEVVYGRYLNAKKNSD